MYGCRFPWDGSGVVAEGFEYIGEEGEGADFWPRGSAGCQVFLGGSQEKDAFRMWAAGICARGVGLLADHKTQHWEELGVY